MGKCVKCQDLFHPDYMLVIDEETEAQKCVWCYLDKKEIVIEDENDGKPIAKLTREEATKNYKRWLREMKDRPNIQRIMG